MATKKATSAAKTVESSVEPDQIRTTGISLPTWGLDLLMDVANKRKKARSGRASVSGVLLDLIEQHRDELEHELKS